MPLTAHPHLGKTLLEAPDNMPRVSDVLNVFTKIEGYKEEDDLLTQLYEAKGGLFAKPGSLDLKEHDLLHFLLGINLVPVDGKRKKDNESFVTGFTYGACPQFTDEDLDWWKTIVKDKYPKSSQYGARGKKCLQAGFELGRVWRKNVSIDLEPFLAKAVAEDIKVYTAYNSFISQNMNLLNHIQETVHTRLDQVREGTPESFTPMEYLFKNLSTEEFRENMGWMYGAKASGSPALKL